MKVCAFYSRGPHFLRVLKALRTQYPEVQLVAMVPRYFPLGALESLVDEVRQVEGAAGGLRHPLILLRLLRTLRAASFDVFVTMFDSTRLRLLARASAAPACYCQTLDGRQIPLRGSLLLQGCAAVKRNLAGRLLYGRLRRRVRAERVQGK